MDSQQSKSGKFVPCHPFRETLPWESPGLCIWCPRVSSGWVQRMYFLSYLYVLPVPADNNNGYYLSSRVTKVPCWCKAEILCSQMGNGTQELRRQWDLSKESFCLRSPVWEAHPHGSWPGSVLSMCSAGAGNLFLCSDTGRVSWTAGFHNEVVVRFFFFFFVLEV